MILRVGRALRVQHGDVLYHHKELGRKAQVGFLGLHAASTATPVARATSSPERATQLGLRRRKYCSKSIAMRRKGAEINRLFDQVPPSPATARWPFGAEVRKASIHHCGEAGALK